MLNSKALTDLFSQNCDPKLCKQWWLMTPNGTLLAHSSSTPLTPSAVRRQVAIVALAWQEYDTERSGADGDILSTARLRDDLRTLTIESITNNIIATRVQSQLILVLEGGIPPRRPGFEAKTVAEGPDDDQYPADGDNASKAATKLDDTPSQSRASSIVGNAARTVLRLQRKKLEAMANAIADNFQQTGFQLPDEEATKFF